MMGPVRVWRSCVPLALMVTRALTAVMGMETMEMWMETIRDDGDVDGWRCGMETMEMWMETMEMWMETMEMWMETMEMWMETIRQVCLLHGHLPVPRSPTARDVASTSECLFNFGFAHPCSVFPLWNLELSHSI
jgi:hypothetical protein